MTESCIPDFTGRPSVTARIMRAGKAGKVSTILGGVHYSVGWANRDALRQLEREHLLHPDLIEDYRRQVIEQGNLEVA